MKYKLIIFDFDGTLADTLPWTLSVIDHLADKYKVPRLDRSQLDQVRRLDAKTLLKRYKVPAWKLPGMARYIHRLMSQYLRAAERHPSLPGGGAGAGQITLFEGVNVMLARLAEAGVKLAVVSSNSRDNVRRVLGPANVARIRYFECGVSMFGKYARLRKVLRRARVRPGEALAVGDELRDVDAARRAHIPFGAVAWGYTHFEALQARAPREAFASVDQIISVVLAPE